MKNPDDIKAAFSFEDLKNPAVILRALLHCKSVTPEDDGALELMCALLEKLGFSCKHLSFGPKGQETPNLFASLDRGEGAYFCFAGHTDVVPPGEGWSVDPFAGDLQHNVITGRGAVDMKGGLACMLAATARQLEKNNFRGKLAFLLTGDEEGEARFGTVKLVEWLEQQQEKPDFCLLAEPTSVDKLADVIKIGRRGSLNAVIMVQGQQGHVAYPHLVDNPVPVLLKILHQFQHWVLDTGSEYFEASSLQFTELKTADGASNVIPSSASARFNIRFNDLHTGQELSDHIREIVGNFPNATVAISVSGDSFLTKPGHYVERLEAASQRVTGYLPRRETGGGTSDARFISKYMPVAELGLLNKTMHKVDECTSVEDLEKLTRIYEEFLG